MLTSTVTVPASELDGATQITRLLDSTETILVVTSSRPTNLQNPSSALKPLPVMVIRVPPMTPPDDGLTDSTCTVSSYSNSAIASVPYSSTVTDTRPGKDPTGTTTVEEPSSAVSTATKVLPKVIRRKSDPDASSPVIVTTVPPTTGPRLGTSPNVSASLKLKRKPVLVKSCPLLLISIDTLPGLLAGEVHTTMLTDGRRLRVTDFIPNRQERSLESAKLPPTNVMLDPPVTAACEGITCVRMGSL